MFNVYWPLKGIISSRFGWRTKPKPGWHSGLDIAAPKRTPIKSAYRGTVVNIGDWGNYGNIVNIHHNTIGDVYTLYAHLFEITCKVGDRIEAGDTIGLVGSTGYSTGPHLHFEIRVGGNKITYADDPEKHLIEKLMPAIYTQEPEVKTNFISEVTRWLMKLFNLL